MSAGEGQSDRQALRPLRRCAHRPWLFRHGRPDGRLEEPLVQGESGARSSPGGMIWGRLLVRRADLLGRSAPDRRHAGAVCPTSQASRWML